MFTRQELEVLMPVVDAGIRASGLQLFRNKGGVQMQAILDKLQVMADAAANEQEGARNGQDQHHD